MTIGEDARMIPQVQARHQVRETENDDPFPESLDSAVGKGDDRRRVTLISPLLQRTSQMTQGNRRLDIEEVNGVTIARFTDKKILDESNIQIIGNQLFNLVDEDHRQKIVLDFTNVEYLSSAALGKLITMDKKVKAAGGKLRLCSIRSDIKEVFKITRLDKLFQILDKHEWSPALAQPPAPEGTEPALREKKGDPNAI
jgi:anti-sigma B factor antagonist